MVERHIDVVNVIGSSPIPPTKVMKTEKIKSSEIRGIESQKAEELWDKLTDDRSKENLKSVFKDALAKLINEPNLYYLESDKDNKFAIVRKRADDSSIYETGDPTEIGTLRTVGVGK